MDFECHQTDKHEHPLALALRVWGTEEQQRKYLPAIAGGTLTFCRPLMEPGQELDLSNLNILAWRDGDDVILEGEGVYAADGRAPACIWTLAITDPKAPPRQGVGMFLLPIPWERVAMRALRHLGSGTRWQVAFDHARVPPSCLIGEAHDGWALAAAALLARWNAEESLVSERLVTDLLDYARNTRRNGKPLSQDPILQQLLVEAFIDCQIGRLLRMRNQWMRSTGQGLTYQDAQHALWVKQSAMRLSEIVRDVMGIYAMLDRQDPRTPLHGEFELQQRESLVNQNLGGGPEVQAAAMAEHLGLPAPHGQGESAAVVRQ